MTSEREDEDEDCLRPLLIWGEVSGTDWTVKTMWDVLFLLVGVFQAKIIGCARSPTTMTCVDDLLDVCRSASAWVSPPGIGLSTFSYYWWSWVSFCSYLVKHGKYLVNKGSD